MGVGDGPDAPAVQVISLPVEDHYRRVLTLSPFRLGAQPNVRVGVAMITSAPEALALHEKTTKEMWRRAIKGPPAVALMGKMIAKYRN